MNINALIRIHILEIITLINYYYRRELYLNATEMTSK
jgi:hypothetical protein